MGIAASIVLECDECATTDHDDLELDESPEDFIDKGGWHYEDKITSTRLLCQECYDEEQGA